ncbi:MAG TPA: 5-formyltetrahydrofolate cyclo-ligase [Cyclobacteriaceae bacterium]|nr:5-formyltetrahydrofolate cyclo-ligase [Cyclobacteriaceae bacterium]HMV07578.1 5-formyltetrahydrofolate cyclo-ligase [Cyclobacteriaceae bacterium]HMV89032.1 5-formyltetrahydrofolate cyclo-ligase [Cyclobacteriaceae bacterium]HMW98713.1 5-formyltetrahydrofolate cyclo-ligase [Cyclobacteriaceae bacterium]HMX48653.1 5-formyltetrahydrofolate cyclo-ligase [Cyclobacteriaceae bacterium]
MTKQELRKIYTQKRAALSEAQYGQLNFQLYQNFFSTVDLSFVKVLHTFLPIIKKKEVDTWLILDRIRREFPHVRISIPKVNGETGVFDSFYFEGLHQLATNEWGIQEPKQGIPTEPDKIDIVLIPLLAYDKYGNRAGYGKGFYDKFLATCRPDCQKIGLSLFGAEEKISDANQLDIKMDVCITPSDVIRFS